MLRIRNPKLAAAIAGVATVVALGAASIAYGIFRESSTAQASGNSANMAPLTVGTGDNAPAYDFAGNEKFLWPNVGGNHVARVMIQVTNPNEVAVQVAATGISGTATFVYDDDRTACGSKLRTTDTPTLTGGPVTVGAGATATLTVTGVYLDADANDTCQDKPFKTTWTIVGTAL